MESGSPRSGWFLLVPCTALCRGSDKYLSNWMGWNYETAGPHVWFFISKPRPLSLGHRCQQKTENEACHGSFFCDSFSVLRAGKRNSLSGVTQFTWRETPEMSSHGWQCFPGKSSKMLKLTEILQELLLGCLLWEWLLCGAQEFPGGFWSSESGLPETLEATTHGNVSFSWSTIGCLGTELERLLQGQAVGGKCEPALGSLEVQGVPGMCSVHVQHLLLGEVTRSAGLCESGTIRGFKNTGLLGLEACLIPGQSGSLSLVLPMILEEPSRDVGVGFLLGFWSWGTGTPAHNDGIAQCRALRRQKCLSSAFPDQEAMSRDQGHDFCPRSGLGELAHALWFWLWG